MNGPATNLHTVVFVGLLLWAIAATAAAVFIMHLFNGYRARIAERERRSRSTQRNLVDKIADAATPKVDKTDASKRPAWWWIFFMPGKVILWIQYMFPERKKRIVGVFGSARRRNVPLIQILYSLYFYLMVVIVGLLIFPAIIVHFQKILP
jgi:hypothetical protein